MVTRVVSMVASVVSMMTEVTMAQMTVTVMTNVVVVTTEGLPFSVSLNHRGLSASDDCCNSERLEHEFAWFCLNFKTRNLLGL